MTPAFAGAGLFRKPEPTPAGVYHRAGLRPDPLAGGRLFRDHAPPLEIRTQPPLRGRGCALFAARANQVTSSHGVVGQVPDRARETADDRSKARGHEGV